MLFSGLCSSVQMQFWQSQELIQVGLRTHHRALSLVLSSAFCTRCASRGLALDKAQLPGQTQPCEVLLQHGHAHSLVQNLELLSCPSESWVVVTPTTGLCHSGLSHKCADLWSCSWASAGEVPTTVIKTCVLSKFSKYVYPIRLCPGEQGL